jgi:hypothetical protein
VKRARTVDRGSWQAAGRWVMACVILSGGAACLPGSLDGLQNGRRSDSGARDVPWLSRDSRAPDLQRDTSIVQVGDTSRPLDLQPQDWSSSDASPMPFDGAVDTDDLDVPSTPTPDLGDAPTEDELGRGYPVEVGADSAGAQLPDAGESDDSGGIGTGGIGAGGGSGTGGDGGSVGGATGMGGAVGSGGAAGGGGNRGSGGIRGSGGSVTIRDASTDAPEVRWDAPRPCVGVADSGICWYLGRAGDSCANACANHGGTASQAASHIGTSAQGGSLTECARLLSLLGIRASVAEGTRSDGLGLGCHLFGSDRWWLTSPAYTDTSRDAVAQIVCGCVQ